jgi:hypothetical protein
MKRLAFAVISLLALAAHAQEADRPWAKGVGKDQQRIALQMFQEGNALLKESLFPRAVDKYREALTHWDHPAIHYNMALALLALEKPVETYQHLEKAMAYGDAPLDVEKFQHAKSYKALIEKQVGRLVITCDVAGATVTMDGATLFTAPGKYTGLVVSGPHTIVANKTGFMTTEKTKNIPAAETTTIELKVYTAEELTRYTHKWQNWIPWSVVAGGAAFVIAGGLFTWQARKDFSDFDAAIKDPSCNGCIPSDAILSKKSSGDTLQTISVVSYAIGGAALVTGAVLVYINRPRAYRINPIEREPAANAPIEPAVSVLPLLGPHVGGAMVTLSF